MYESTVVTRQLTQIGEGATKTVFLDGKNPNYVLAVSHGKYTIEELLPLIEQEMQSRKRCLEFFASMPTLVVKERWILPLTDDMPGGSTETDFVDNPNAPMEDRIEALRKAIDAKRRPMKSVRETIKPFKDTPDHSSLGEHGVKPEDLTPAMRQQVEQVVAEIKSGILKAMSAEDDQQGLVPDLRGENFMFDKEGSLRFVDTNRLSNCRMTDSFSMREGLRDSLAKVACIERYVLGRAGSELWNDPFYVTTTSRWRAQAGNEGKTIDAIFA